MPILLAGKVADRAIGSTILISFLNGHNPSIMLTEKGHELQCPSIKQAKRPRGAMSSPMSIDCVSG